MSWLELWAMLQAISAFVGLGICILFIIIYLWAIFNE